MKHKMGSERAFPHRSYRNVRAERELLFPLLWDEGNRVAERFGLKHDFSEATRGLFKAFEIDIEELNGAEAGWSLPLASTYIIDKTGMIRHAIVTADWRIRPDPNDTLERLKQVIAEQ
jgi:peroxiredoxin